jgi:hypothetical protein
MKVLLRSIKTGLYYEKGSRWTPDQKAALDFETTTRAVELVFASRLENVEMLLTSFDPRFDLVLPIKGGSSPTSPAPASDDRPPKPRNATTPATHNKETRRP